jgi:hypothetical protein
MRLTDEDNTRCRNLGSFPAGDAYYSTASFLARLPQARIGISGRARRIARCEAVGTVGLSDSLGPAWNMLLIVGLGGAEGESKALALTGGVAVEVWGSGLASIVVVGSVGMSLASTAAVAAADVVAATNESSIESTELVPAESSDPEVTTSMGLAECVGWASAGMGFAGNDRDQTESMDSRIGSEGGLHNSRQILRDVDRQGVDCYTLSQAHTTVDTGRHTLPAECLSGAAVGCPDTLGRQDCCLPTVVAGTQGLACLYFSFSLDDPDHHGCELIPSYSMR